MDSSNLPPSSQPSTSTTPIPIIMPTTTAPAPALAPAAIIPSTPSSTASMTPILGTPTDPSTPPTSFTPLARTASFGHSPTQSPKVFLHRRRSSAASPKLHRRASEHFEDRVGALRNDGDGKLAEAEVDIRMPKEDMFIEDIAMPEAQLGDSPNRSRSQSPLCPASPPRPTAHHISAVEPPKLQHGHSGLCSPPVGGEAPPA